MTDLQIFLGILAMAAATLLTRALPFMLFSAKEPPQRLIRGARLIPGAVMLILVLSSLPIVGFLHESAEPQFWLPWVSVVIVAALHLLFRQTLLSIIAGTAFYMIVGNILGAL